MLSKKSAHGLKCKKKRKVCHRCQLLEAEIERLKQKCQRLRDENVAKDVYCKTKMQKTRSDDTDDTKDMRAEIEAKQSAEIVGHDKMDKQFEELMKKARMDFGGPLASEAEEAQAYPGGVS
jgi:hypothetical protein